MKNNYLVIFFIGIFFSFLIYKSVPNKKEKILIIGDNYLFNTKYKSYDTYFNNKYDINKLFLEDESSYKKIINNINNNYFIYFKNTKIYLNQIISDANYIIINANNNEYNIKCEKNYNNINDYNNYLKKELKTLRNKINRISNAKIIVIGNYCTNSDNYSYGDINIKKIINNSNNMDFYSKNKLSQDGNYSIFNLINDKI